MDIIKAMSVKEQKLHEGIVLFTETVNAKEISMSIKNDILKVLTFTVDLTGSAGVKIKESSTLINVVDIDPHTKKVIATLILDDN